MTANQTRRLMIKAKALFHIEDLAKTIRRGEVLELSEDEANRSNDLWKGQQFGLLEIKWIMAGTQVALPKAQTVVVASRAQLVAHTQQLQPASTHASQQDVEGLRQSLDSLRSDLASVTQQAAQAKREMRAEIAKLETRLALLERGPKPDLTQGPKKPKEVKEPKETKEPTDAGMD